MAGRSRCCAMMERIEPVPWPLSIPASSQRGVALLQLLVVLTVIGTWAFLSFWNTSSARQQQQRTTQQALEQAKQALLGWSVSRGTSANPGFPGQLPCPEDTSLIGTSSEGQAASSCTVASPVIGRLPWRTLKLGSAGLGDGEQLWYVLSPGFRVSPVNTTTIGKLTVDGVANAAVALIIAPGPPLSGQNRSIPTAASPPAVGDYLDLGNASGPNFVSSGPTATFDDQIMVITQNELAQAMAKRVVGEMIGDKTANGLHRYYNDHATYPWADVTADGYGDINQSIGSLPIYDMVFDTTTRNWLTANGWYLLVTYSRSTSYAGQISVGGISVKAAE